MGSILYVLIGLALTVAVGVGIIVWSVNNPNLTARWRGCGRRVFWFSVLFMLAAGLTELLVMWFIQVSPLINHLTVFFVVFTLLIGVVEEGGKLLAVVVGTSQLRRVTSSLDLFSYGAISAGAFTMLENVMYSAQGDFSWGLGIARSLLSTPMHICCTAVAVLGILRWYETGKRRYVVLHYGVSALIHGLYDFVLLLFSTNLVITVLFGVGVLGMLVAILVSALRVPGRYAASHSMCVCPCCGWRDWQHHVRCCQCGNARLLRLVELPRLVRNPSNKQKEVQHEE